MPDSDSGDDFTSALLVASSAVLKEVVLVFGFSGVLVLQMLLGVSFTTTRLPLSLDCGVGAWSGGMFAKGLVKIPDFDASLAMGAEEKSNALGRLAGAGVDCGLGPGEGGGLDKASAELSFEAICLTYAGGNLQSPSLVALEDF